MGALSWALTGLLAGIAVRWVAAGRPAAFWPEPLIGASGALLFGIAATALDFGGWREIDWRTILFCLFGALAVLGSIRLLRLWRIR